ncbi:hypothetical protein D3C86_2234760 [compost metagenome]
MLTHPIEGSEPWPDEEPLELEIESSDEDSDNENSGDEDSPTIEWDMTKDPENPEDPDQPKLF